MKQWLLVLVLVLVVCGNAIGGKTPPKKKPARPAKPQPAAVLPSPDPKIPFEAYAVVDAGDGALLEGLNMHLPWPQASLTKLMLANVVVDKLERGELRLSDRVTVSKNAQGDIYARRADDRGDGRIRQRCGLRHRRARCRQRGRFRGTDERQGPHPGHDGYRFLLRSRAAA